MKYPQIEPMDEACVRLDKRCKALEEELAVLRKHTGHVQEMLNTSRARQIECQERERFRLETECKLVEENRRLRTWMGDSIVRSDYRSADHMRATIDGLQEAVRVLGADFVRLFREQVRPFGNPEDWASREVIANPIAMAAVVAAASKAGAEQSPAVGQGGAEEDEQDQREGQHRQI